jgi:hypothetical protein
MRQVEHLVHGNPVTVIDMNQELIQCAMCNTWDWCDYSVPWDNGEPVPQGYSDSAYMRVCKRCYGRWEIADEAFWCALGHA